MSNPGASDNPYDPSSQDYDSYPKTLAEVMRVAIDSWIRANLYVQLPAQVLRVRNNSTVDVQPMIKEQFIVQGLVTLPPIQSIPIEHPRGTNWWIKLPVQVGDYGKINFYDRSLDNYLVQGGIVDPQDVRMHHLSDATFTPGLYPQSNILPGNPTDMILHNGSAEIYLHANGTFEVTNGKNELLSVINSFIQAVESLNSSLTSFTQTITSSASVGVAPPTGGPVVPSPAFATLLTQVEQLSETLEEIQNNLGTLEGEN